MSTRPKPLSKTYFGHPIGDGQNPDEPWDTSAGTGPTAEKIGGKGSQGGGSKPTPQTAVMKRGSARLGSTAPRNTQRIRGR